MFESRCKLEYYYSYFVLKGISFFILYVESHVSEWQCCIILTGFKIEKSRDMLKLIETEIFSGFPTINTKFTAKRVVLNSLRSF